MAQIDHFVLSNKTSPISYDAIWDYTEAQEHITIETVQLEDDTILVWPYFACNDYAAIEEFASDCNCNLIAIYYT